MHPRIFEFRRRLDDRVNGVRSSTTIEEVGSLTVTIAEVRNPRVCLLGAKAIAWGSRHYAENPIISPYPP